MFLFIRSLDSWSNRFLLSPEANAAGRLGIFRILYSLFYLWYLSANKISYLSSLPDDAFRQFILLSYLFPKPLPFILSAGLEFCLVAALVMLLAGLYTRLSTFAILFSGCLLEACYSSVDHELGMVFLVFYIPLFMVITGGWEDTFSLDSNLPMSRGRSKCDPASSVPKYSLPINALVLVLSVLFLSSFTYKVLGSWLDYPQLISNLVLDRNIRAAIYELPLNTLAPFISKTPFAYHSLRIVTLLFEGTFILAFFSKRLRNIYFPLALVFHAYNAIWLNVTFTPILILYGLFVDWISVCTLLSRVKIVSLPKAIVSHAISSKALAYIVFSGAVTYSILWNTNADVLRPLLNFNGLLNWQTIWYPVLPISVIWLLFGTMSLFPKQLVKGATS